jgi:hypothetical protein
MSLTRDEVVKRLTDHIKDTLNRFTATQVAEEFVTIYENYRQLALIATKDQFEDDWTHEQLMQFLKNGEF